MNHETKRTLSIAFEVTLVIVWFALINQVFGLLNQPNDFEFFAGTLLLVGLSTIGVFYAISLYKRLRRFLGYPGVQDRPDGPNRRASSHTVQL